MKLIDRIRSLFVRPTQQELLYKKYAEELDWIEAVEEDDYEPLIYFICPQCQQESSTDNPFDVICDACATDNVRMKYEFYAREAERCGWNVKQ